jgi:NAD(P)-dependent dehydrogenase (short-subunit alcohol dehydrogenase family)
MCTSWDAREGICYSLGKEVKSFGIRVTALERGMFRTDWAARSIIRSEQRISDDNALFNSIRAARVARSGNRPGDPAKAGTRHLGLSDRPFHTAFGNHDHLENGG